MAYGLIYNLNFASNIGDRKHLLSIYKDGHTATITTSDNNIIGTQEPVVVVWDNNDDIYNNIMGSRLEINLYSDPVKQIDVADILTGTSPSRYKVILSCENPLGVLEPYWEGYISNATFEQGISSTPKPYKLIATDLLSTLKNVYTTDGTAVINSSETVIKYIDNVFGFLPQVYNYKISNNIELKPYKFFFNPAENPNQFTKMHQLQWVAPFKNGFDLAFDNAYDYLQNTLKPFNSRLFYANGYWHIINNCSYADTAEFDYFDTSGVYSSTASENVVKTIPTDLIPINNDLNIRYDSPYDVVEMIVNNNPYATQFEIDNVGAEINNLTPYPSFETKVNGILFNNTYYSDNYSPIESSHVKVGNYSIKTQNFIRSGTPTQKIMDTGFQGDFQWDATGTIYFYTSFYLGLVGDDSNDVFIYYSLLRETSGSSLGTNPTRSYYNGSTWVNYTNEANATKLSIREQTAPQEQWVDVTQNIITTGSNLWARYRIILWQPKYNDVLGSPIFHFDQVLLSRKNSLNFDKPIRTISKLASSTRRNKKLVYEFDSFYPVYLFGTLVKTDTIEPDYLAQLNEVLSQQILNDNRTHIKRYTITCTPNNNQFIYPYHKIGINFSGYSSDANGIIDRMRFLPKSNLYELEFHEPNQATNVSINMQITG